MVEATRSTKAVSLPTELVDGLDAFVERHGKALGYRGRAEFIAAAIRKLQESEERRILRQLAIDHELGDNENAEAWKDL